METHMTYTSYLQKCINDYDYGVPVYTDHLADAMACEFNIPKANAAAAVAVAIKRLMDRKKIPELRRFQKGIYYRAAETPFGETDINTGKLIADRYLLPDKGYETGLGLLHHLGLTTQMPAESLIATNSAGNCLRHDKKLGVSICPPRVPVTADNKAYLQILDAMDYLARAPVDADEPYRILAAYITDNQLDYENLLYLADKYYNHKTIMILAHTAGQKERGKNESTLR